MIEALGITCIKNEADIIEAFVRHNLQFMDLMIIIDNDSIDGTRDILIRLRQAGYPIVLFDDPIVAYFQAEKVTAVYRRVVPMFKPRFVFLLDADEFIVAPSRDALHAQLRKIRPGSKAQYYWRTYIPAPTGVAGDVSDPLRSITHRRVAEEPWAKSIIVTKPKIDSKLKIGQGGHDVRCWGRSLRTVRLKNVALAHFPVRSIDQITSKALVGWIANLERNRHDRPRGFAFQWELLHQRIVHGTGLNSNDLTQEALRYGQTAKSRFLNLKWPQDVIYDPIVPGYTALTARSPTTCSTLQKVVRSVERILNPEGMFAETSTTAELPQDASETARWRTVLSPAVAARKLRTARARRRNAKNLYVDLPPFSHLAERDSPASVLHIGCNSSEYLRYFATKGTRRVKGIDRLDNRFTLVAPDEYESVDLGVTFDLSEVFDLIICLDQVQQSGRKNHRLLAEDIVRHASRRIVFSAVGPAQLKGRPAYGQAILEWLEVFEAVGWHPNLMDTLAMRSLSTFPWLRSNLVVLTRDSRDPRRARDYLIDLERSKSKWSKQRPGVVTHPFMAMRTELLRNQGR